MKKKPKHVFKKKLLTTFEMQPIGDRVLIRPFKEADEKIVGKIKIIMPESVSNQKTDRGEVIAIGEGRIVDGKLIPLNINVGDTVVYNKYSYDEVQLRGEELYLIKWENLLAVIK
ncbi:MAG: co-chaperone GroES [Minisyncoccota bacterium]